MSNREKAEQIVKRLRETGWLHIPYDYDEKQTEQLLRQIQSVLEAGLPAKDYSRGVEL